jgi:hypothetical protein
MARKPSISSRKPPAAAIEDFIHGGGARSSPAGGQGPQGGKTTRREIRTGKSKGQLEARVTVCVPDSLLKKAKLWCISNNSTLSAVFETALRERVGD